VQSTPAAFGIRLHRDRGFTLIELLVVVALIAIVSAAASLALRDGDASLLDQEAERLSALFESARAQSRISGQAVSWVPLDNAAEEQFRFNGLPAEAQMPHRWLKADVKVSLAQRVVQLGPEPLIPAQRVLLSLGAQTRVLRTDGLSPFAVDNDVQEP